MYELRNVIEIKESHDDLILSLNKVRLIKAKI